ncbi:MAG: Rpn family recombination-promoting nuclease/putative transposase [Planctomycetes bacterium]|nr:Rpn family recombination-promoting nuclease/putative transposase [Planctomycetota bacterium]
MQSHAHDSLFRSQFGQTAEAAAELRLLLSARAAAQLDLAALVRVDTAWVDRELRGSAADLLFRAPLRAGGDAFLLFLMEHQSTPDPRLPLRLLRYATQIWERHAAETPPSTPLPPVIPVLIHQGPRPWPWPPRFRTHLAGGADLHEALAPNLIEFDYLIDDLGTQSDAQIFGRAMSAIGRLTLIALRNGRAIPRLAEHLAGFLRELHHDLRGPAVVPALSRLVSYVLAVGDGTPREVRATLAAALPTEHRSEVMTTAEMLRAEGKAEGLVEGWRMSVTGLLEARFRALSPAARERIAAADLAMLQSWQRRVLSARDEAELFGE